MDSFGFSSVAFMFT